MQDSTYIINRQNFGKQFKRAIESKHGMSQLKLANMLGISKTTVNSYANGKSLPSLDQLFRIAEALNKPVEFFFEDPVQYSAKSRGDIARMAMELLKTNSAALTNCDDGTVALVIQEHYLSDFLRAYNDYFKLVENNPSIKESFEIWKNDQLNRLDDEQR